MKPIPGYEIVEGEFFSCEKCDFYTGSCPCKKPFFVACDNDKIYKKIEEKTMTHDEIIEVVKGHREGRELQYQDKITKVWFKEKPHYDIIAILRAVCRGHFYRVKPEPKIIPWTIKDAEIFLEKTLTKKASLETYRVTSCNLSGLFMKKIKADEYESIFFLYETILTDFIFNGKPCGKVVEK